MTKKAWATWVRAAAKAGLVVLFGLAAPILSGASTAEPEASRTDAGTQVRERDLLRAVNDYRAAQGLLRWREDAGLAAIARAHSRRMAREGRLSHEGFRQRALRAGSVLCVENLVAGHGVPEQAVAMWRRSPAHHANLLDDRAAWAGVGVAGRFATLLACATPAAAVGSPSEDPGAGGESPMSPPAQIAR
jgi:uncharacterized protein YkwD